MSVRWIIVVIVISTIFTPHLFPQEEISVDAVIDMWESGVAADVIVELLKKERAEFDLTTDDVKSLTEAGLPEDVILYMLGGEEEDVVYFKVKKKELVAPINHGSRFGITGGVSYSLIRSEDEYGDTVFTKEPGSFSFLGGVLFKFFDKRPADVRNARMSVFIPGIGIISEIGYDLGHYDYDRYLIITAGLRLDIFRYNIASFFGEFLTGLFRQNSSQNQNQGENISFVNANRFGFRIGGGADFDVSDNFGVGVKSRYSYLPHMFDAVTYQEEMNLETVDICINFYYLF